MKRKGEGFIEVLGCVFLVLIIGTVLMAGAALVMQCLKEAQRIRDADRVITVYGSNGPIRQWTGKFDVKYDYYCQRVTFYSGDKCIVIRGGTVINEEQ